MTRIVRVIAVLGVCLLPFSAHAALSCRYATVGMTVSFPTVAVPINASIGDELATNVPQKFTILCSFTSTTNPRSDTSATLYATLTTKTALAQGFKDVYQTNVPGVGVRYRLKPVASARCSPQDGILSAAGIRFSCPMSGPVDGPYMPTDVSLTATLIATGAIKGGTSSITKVPALDTSFTVSDQSAVWVQPQVFNGSASGALTRATCSIKQNKVSVDLPVVPTGAFSPGVGTVAGARRFALSLACVTGTTLFITFTDGVDSSNRSDILNLAKDSTARGVGVRLLNSSGRPIRFGPDSSAKGNPNQWQVGPSPDGPLAIPLTAQYVSTGSVSAGSVKALATFTMSYQ